MLQPGCRITYKPLYVNRRCIVPATSIVSGIVPLVGEKVHFPNVYGGHDIRVKSREHHYDQNDGQYLQHVVAELRLETYSMAVYRYRRTASDDGICDLRPVAIIRNYYDKYDEAGGEYLWWMLGSLGMLSEWEQVFGESEGFTYGTCDHAEGGVPESDTECVLRHILPFRFDELEEGVRNLDAMQIAPDFLEGKSGTEILNLEYEAAKNGDFGLCLRANKKLSAGIHEFEVT